MWRQLKFRNLKCLKDVNLDLEPLTVLVGSNGTGKSSVLMGARLLAELTAPPPLERDPSAALRERFRAGGPVDPKQLRTCGIPDDEYISLVGAVMPGAQGQPRDDIRMRLRPAFLNDPDRTPWIEILHNGVGGYISPRDGGGGQGETAFRECAALGHGPAMALALNGDALARPSVLSEETSTLGRDGYGLPSLLAAMAATDRTSIDALEADLQRVVPRARRIRTPPTKVVRSETQIITLSGRDHAVDTSREVMGNRLELEMNGAGFLDGSLLSDGTLVALGLLALLHSKTSPKLLLIDDLDHSMHPSAHRALIDALRGLLASRPEVQILCTTHAPYLLDHFRAEEIRVLTLNEQGHTQSRRLADHPEWVKFHGSLSTGEFWSTVGEQWVASDPGAWSLSR